MCGIFGYISARKTNVAALAHRALCDLEYRGYDSWGIAVKRENNSAEEIVIMKDVGKVSEALDIDFRTICGTAAIGHSRWATHGGISKENAHPHTNRERTIAVIHNGIIENHNELRVFLSERFGIPGHELFVSETDTEVIPHLIDYFMVREGKNFEEAFIAAGQMLEGRYAIVVMKAGEPYLLAMRDGSPLVLGVGNGEHYIASDAPAFLDYTRTAIFPGDREYLKVSADTFLVRNLDSGKKTDITQIAISWDKASATKEGYPHYMFKEIMEQPQAIDAAIRQDDARLLQFAEGLRAATHRFFIGCGTAAKMAKLGELYAAKVGNTLAGSFVGSEFPVYEQFLNRKSAVLAISQSGETADVLEALRLAERSGAKIFALLNVVGSSMHRMSRETLFLNVGPEIAVASTKAATAQIAVLILIAHALAGKELLAEGKRHMRKTVKAITSWLTPDFARELIGVAETLRDVRDLYIIGRGLHAPIAQEAAIKIQEVAYVHAEGFAGGELKHGPIALIERGTPVIALLPNDDTQRDMESNVTELKSRGARIIGIAPRYSPLFDEWISVPDIGLASPIASLVPIQLLAYHLAVLRGNDPDKPRNLAKSVTVK